MIKNRKNQAYSGSKIPSVNFHLWKACNFRCKFCFATFQDIPTSYLPKGHLDQDEAIEVVHRLAEFGFEKITFAGGEPTLCPWLPELVSVAKQRGMTTMIVTNGSKLDETFLSAVKEDLDWVALSIDSIKNSTNVKAGRATVLKETIQLPQLLETCKAIKQAGIRLKINTVVNALNWTESMSDFINRAGPERWKMLQVMQVEGQNDDHFNDLAISKDQFQHFVTHHQSACPDTKIVPEKDDLIRGSYVMVDPAGRFFDSTSGTHLYSTPILDSGVEAALAEVNVDEAKFFAREGKYNWLRKSKNKIVLGGRAGAGKSSVGRRLAERLNFEFQSAGNLARDHAEKMGLDIKEFQDHLKSNPEFDLLFDKQIAQWGMDNTNWVYDYRLGGKFLPDAFSVLLDISSSCAAKRVFAQNRGKEFGNGNPYSAIQKGLADRDKKMRERFIETYDFDFLEPSNYDLVINVENLSIDEVVEEIFKRLQNQ